MRRQRVAQACRWECRRPHLGHDPGGVCSRFSSSQDRLVWALGGWEVDHFGPRFVFSNEEPGFARGVSEGPQDGRVGFHAVASLSRSILRRTTDHVHAFASDLPACGRMRLGCALVPQHRRVRYRRLGVGVGEQIGHGAHIVTGRQASLAAEVTLQRLELAM
jgi:hypothetical protein